MSLHSSKKEALIQLTNCISSHNVKTIRELSDGKILLSIIETVFPKINLNLQSEEKQTVHNLEHSKDDENKTRDQDLSDSEKELGSVDESNKEIAIQNDGEEAISVQTENAATSNEYIYDEVMSVAKSSTDISIDGNVIPSSVNDDSSSTIENIDIKDEDFSKIYETIQCFIDDKYNLQSESLVSYKECLKENELELAKVTLFVVSEVVQHYVKTNPALIQTLSLMDLKVQQDLKDCFNLFINERSKITEKDLIKLLSSHASYRVSPATTPFVTPKRSCSSKYKKTQSSSPHDSYINSPLKTYFESPIFTKKDIITKDKEIFKTRQTLYEEECRSNTLQMMVDELKKELKTKDKEIRTLKTTIKEFQDTEKEDCQNCIILSNSLKEKEKEVQETKIFKDEQMDYVYNKYADDLENCKMEFSRRLQEVEYEAGQAKQAKEQCAALSDQLSNIKFELLKREDHIKNLLEQLEEKTKECEISKEKLSTALIEFEKMPEYSIRGECIGGVIEKENEELRQRIKQLELIALSKETHMINKKIQCKENMLECMGEVVKENPDLSPGICDISKQDSFLSLRSRRLTKSVSYVQNGVERNNSIGALWEKYDDSVSNPESKNETYFLEKSISKFMSCLHKLETDFLNEKDNRLKITTKANGSNGLISPNIIKELTENLKSVKKSLLCLPQSAEVINVNNCLSNVAVSCDTCMQKKEKMPSSVSSSASQDSAALLEKTKELDMLREQYSNATASLKIKNNELKDLGRKLTIAQRNSLLNIDSLRLLEMKYQKLKSELRKARLCEVEAKKKLKKEKNESIENQKELKDKLSNVYRKYSKQLESIKSLHEKNKKLEEDLAFSTTRNDELAVHIKLLEKQIKELNNSKSYPASTDKSQAFYALEQMESFEKRIPKTEPLSPQDGEASSSNLEETGNIPASAFPKKYRDFFECDEDSFCIDKCVSGLDEESLNRVPEMSRRKTLCMLQPETYLAFRNCEANPPDRLVELNRRNTLCMPHLQSCYPAEGVPLSIPYKNSLNYVDFAKKGSETENKEPAGKKRKLSEMKTENPLPEVLLTPSTKMRNKFKMTPSSLTKLIRFAREKRGFAKPKPE